MNIPVLTKRRERRDAAITAAAEAAADAALEKKAALAPALLGAPGYVGVGGATYPVAAPGSPVPNPSSPFNQTGGNYGANPLPRPNYDFGSLFGPGYPLFPDALDPLRPDGRASPRRWEYEVTWNIQLVDREVPWSMLRYLATKVDVVSRCIELLQDAIAGMEWAWGFSPQIINQIRGETGETNSAKAVVLAREKYGDELDYVQKFFERPDEEMGYTFTQWLSLMLWSHLVYDGVVVYPVYNLKGELRSLSLLDTSTIKILLNNQGFLPQPPAPAYQQILYGFPRGEFQAEVAGDETKVPNGYRQDQLAYYIRRPRLHTPYGFSHVEECINYATMYQQRQEWMHAEWSHGVTPRLMIETSETENWTPEQMMYYQNAWNDQWSGQTQRRQQAAFLRPGMKPVQLHTMEEVYKSDYDQWLVMQIASKFGVPQLQMGLPMSLHMLSGGIQSTASMDLADKFAIDALVNFLIDCINDLARRFLGVGREITIVAAGANTDKSGLAAAQADASDVNNGIRTRNEVRAERGIPLLTEQEADMLAITTATGVTFIQGQLELQEAQRALVEQGVETEPGRQRSSGKDERADPNVKPTAIRPVREKDTPHKPRNDRGKARPAPKASGAVLSTRLDRGSYHVKELEAFSRFAKARIERGAWRDFEFEHIDQQIAKSLNDAGSRGDLNAIKEAEPEVIAAGIALVADDTGRVLLVQRSVENHSKARGLWEYPGGRLEEGDKPKATAKREFEEETGIDLPKGKFVGSWTTTNGYRCFVYVVDHESDVELENARGLDGTGDHEIENVAWWNPGDMIANPAIRIEVQSSDWALLGHAKKATDLGKAVPRLTAGIQEMLDFADSMHSRIVGHYAPKVQKALTDVVGLDNAIADARTVSGMNNG